jgi:hypothetical protein
MKCMNRDCSERATHEVRLVVPDALSDETAAEGPLGIALCAGHGAEVGTWDFAALGYALTPLVAALSKPGTQPDLSVAYAEAVRL